MMHSPITEDKQQEKLSYRKQIASHSAAHTIRRGHHKVVWPVLKGDRDTSGQWERAKLPLSSHPHTLTDSHQILFTRDYVHHISPYMPHLVKIAPGVTSPDIAKVTTQLFFF